MGREHLKLVRKQGFAMDDEENEKGIRCVGAPIFNETGESGICGQYFRACLSGHEESDPGNVEKRGDGDGPESFSEIGIPGEEGVTQVFKGLSGPKISKGRRV
jgi:hypothetical protein